MNINIQTAISEIYHFLFSKKGRLGRAGFATALILKTIGLTFISLKINDLESTIIEIILFICLAIPVYLSYSALVTRRCHDFSEDNSKYDANEYHIPLIGTLLVFDELLFRPGCKDPNQYGKPSKL